MGHGVTRPRWGLGTTRKGQDVSWGEGCSLQSTLKIKHSWASVSSGSNQQRTEYIWKNNSRKFPKVKLEFAVTSGKSLQSISIVAGVTSGPETMWGLWGPAGAVCRCRALLCTGLVHPWASASQGVLEPASPQILRDYCMFVIKAFKIPQLNFPAKLNFSWRSPIIRNLFLWFLEIARWHTSQNSRIHAAWYLEESLYY